MERVIFIASDHAGFVLKAELIAHLSAAGHQIKDLGTHSKESCDYPVYANELCAEVLATENSVGILICGSGIGMSIAANRHKGIRAALCTCEFQAKYTRLHNNANVLCLAERVTGCGVALAIADVFLSESFEGGRHSRRVDMLDK